MISKKIYICIHFKQSYLMLKKQYLKEQDPSVETKNTGRKKKLTLA
jgi:hypothetical protein